MPWFDGKSGFVCFFGTEDLTEDPGLEAGMAPLSYISSPGKSVFPAPFIKRLSFFLPVKVFGSFVKDKVDEYVWRCFFIFYLFH